MQAFFSLDSKFMQAMSRIFDLTVLNILYLLTCLPVFTIGAANTALYSVCFRIGTDREEGIFRSYLRAFRENFRQSTPLFLLLLLLGLSSGFNIFYFGLQTGSVHYLSYLFLLILILIAMVSGYAFPLMSQFNSPTAATIKNAFLLSVGYLPRTLAIVILNFLPLAVFLDIPLFLKTGFLWAFLYFSAAAYINARLLRKVFAPYMTVEEETK